MPQLKTGANGFFTSDNKTYVNLDVSKSSPNRKGSVKSIETMKDGSLCVTVQFRDLKQCYTATCPEGTPLKEKTTGDIDDWFTAEVKKALNEIPELVRKVSKGNPEYVKILAESVARRLGFRPGPVGKILTELL